MLLLRKCIHLQSGFVETMGMKAMYDYITKMDKDLCIYSYNSRGFDSTKQDILKTLLSISGDSLPVLCNQENFLLKANGFIIEKCLPDHHIFFKPATKKGLNGRPKNGMFVAVPISLKESVQDVSPHSSRIQCILIETQNDKIIAFVIHTFRLIEDVITSTKPNFYLRYLA